MLVFTTNSVLPGAAGNTNARKELAAITYAANVLGSRGPRKMQVIVPAVDDHNVALGRVRPGEEELLQRIKDRNFRDSAYLINKVSQSCIFSPYLHLYTFIVNIVNIQCFHSHLDGTNKSVLTYSISTDA